MRRNDASDALGALGEALHPFQDSWSHQGVPDVPLRPGLRLRPDLSSAHPEARGGWFSKAADRTYLHVSDVTNMARETFAVLQRYLQHNSQWRVRASADWSALEPIVREFAEASTRQQKDAWAVKHIPRDWSASVEAGRYLSLPAGPASFARQFQAVRPPSALASSAEVPTALLEAANGFVNAWIGTRDVAAAAEFVDTTALGDGLAGTLETTSDAAPKVVREWSRRFLAMYLVADHWEVDAAGHADPQHPEYATMPETSQGEGPFRTLSVLQPPKLGADHFVVLEKTPPGPGFGVALRMSDLPYEVVAFVWREIDGRWLITSMFYVLN
ncbi:MAG: hypothetical protein GEU99_02235 [Luteitalea sp.]|nr:hypothetical protein [Luteitalea sp.]